jgi:VIT1/CCC1 family predicted Fe2+/Mn2+ transporter
MEPALDPSIGQGLVEAELFDLTLYERLRRRASGEMAEVLDALIEVEKRHLAFWKGMFSIAEPSLSLVSHIKLSGMLFLARLFGDSGIHLLIEAIEVHGIQHYLSLWEEHKEDSFGKAIEPILKDELGHEEVIVSSGTKRKIHPERIRDLFLGFNDGLVEVVGAASGFFAAFGTASSVLLAGASVAIAGALSMAAGAYASVGSASEMEELELHRRRFLGEAGEEDSKGSPWVSAAVVGISYFIGALVPLAPVFFGAENLMISVLVSALAAIGISYIVAFFSGMNVVRRIAINLLAVALAVGITYGIGLLAKTVWGIAL